MENYSERVHQESIQERLRSRGNGFAPFELSERATISKLFTEQATRHPCKQAVVDGSSALTFDELRRFSNGISQAVTRAVEERKPIALLCRRYTHFVAAALGVVEAGAFYVPLDPRFPESRTARILNEIGAGVLLTDTELMPLAQRLFPHDDALICLDEVEWKTSASHARIDPDAPACIIFTSGSTGAPKGVIHSQRNLLQFARRYTNSMFLGHADRVSLLSSCSVIASIAPMLSSLLNGATLSSFPVLERGLDALADWLDSDRITIYQSAPSLLRNLLQSIDPDRTFSDVAVVRLGGDTAYRSDWELFTRHFSANAVLVNSYGCSEISGVSRFYMDGASRISHPVLPVGSPLDGVEISLAGTTGTEIGEIVIKSRYLSPGYWARNAGAEVDSVRPSGLPELTTYSTGDLGILRLDQGLVHVGRRDSQVKLSGFRVELAEVEGSLQQYPGVRTAAAAVQPARHGDLQIVGFVEADEKVQICAEEVKRYLARQLPSFMMPAEIVIAREIPLTPNGKVDRAKLPELYQATRRVTISGDPQTSADGLLAVLPAREAREQGEYEPPEDLTEELLAQLWSGLLKSERVGRHDNFFELGGQSLLAMQLVSRIRKAFSTELPVREVFEHPTLSSLARAIDRARGAGTLIDMPLEPVSREQPLPLSYAQQRLWFLQQYIGPSAVYNISRGVRVRGEVDEAALVRSLEELYRRHESLRTRFESVDGSAVQVIDPPGFGLEVEAVSAAEAQAIAHAERFYHFDLSADRLCRIRLLRETDNKSDDYVLLVTMHHSVSDGWSLGVFFRELVGLYRAYSNGDSSPLAPLPIQYADYAQWQRRWLRGEVLEGQLSYWRERLKELPPLLRLPTDRPRPPEQSFRGSIERFVLPASLSEKLHALSCDQGATLYMTLLSAWAVLLGRYAGQQDVVVGTPIANRTRREIEGLIGFFVNTLVMRHDLSGDPRFIDLLKCTRARALEAYANQDIPFEQLVEELNPHRNVSHSPLFQVMFALQNVPFEPLGLPACSMEPLDAEAVQDNEQGSPEATARFDLTLIVRESPAGLVGRAEYNTDLFDRKTIQRMLAHYTRLLQAIADAPQARLSRLEILSVEERRQQLVEWNATAQAYPREKCIHELFEEQVLRGKDAAAVVYGEVTLTYAALEARANRLARHLRGRGVGPDQLVGICMERCVDLVVAVLGVLKAGGAYLPLDPSYPPKRLAYMLEDAGPRVVLTQEKLRSGLAPGRAEVIALDSNHELFAADPESMCERQVVSTEQ
jgi:non-ribosomal peptide synthetase component F/acyl carrier protein